MQVPDFSKDERREGLDCRIPIQVPVVPLDHPDAGLADRGMVRSGTPAFTRSVIVRWRNV